MAQPKGYMGRIHTRTANKHPDFEKIWQAAGIPAGSKVTVTVEAGRIILEAAPEKKGE